MPPGITVVFFNEVYLLPTYASPAQRAWVLRAENDHVADFTTWANTVGRPIAQRVESALLARSFWTARGCGLGVKKAMKDALNPSLRAALAATIATWDTTGRHTWGGPAQRP
jgi:hypothetical protein